MSDLINRDKLLDDLRSLRNTAYKHDSIVYLSKAVDDFIGMVARAERVDSELAGTIVELTDQGFDIQFSRYTDVIYPGKYIAVFVSKGEHYQKTLIDDFDRMKPVEYDGIFAEVLEKSKNDIKETNDEPC